MDYQWYYPATGSGEDKPELETDTITVTEDMSSASWKTDRIDSDYLAWQVAAFKDFDGQISPVEIDVKVSTSKPSTAFEFSWLTRFAGYINITTWKKNRQ